MSLGCRNISVVETYRRGNAPCPLVLIPGHGVGMGTHARRSYLPLSGHCRSFIVPALENTKPTADRLKKESFNEACIAHRSNYLSNPIYPSRRVLASRRPTELLDSLVSVCRWPSGNPPRLFSAVAAVFRTIIPLRPSSSRPHWTSGRILVSSALSS